MGLVIESPALAQRLSSALDTRVPEVAYEVRATADSKCLEWIERTAGGEVRHDVEPGTRAYERGWVLFLSILPIDWLL
jgi:putative cardiolipin synthase